MLELKYNQIKERILMKVVVIDTGYSVELNEDGEFKCLHKNTVVNPPCCNGSDCGCGGVYDVYCEDCDNEDLEDYEADLILEGSNYYE